MQLARLRVRRPNRVSSVVSPLGLLVIQQRRPAHKNADIHAFFPPGALPGPAAGVQQQQPGPLSCAQQEACAAATAPGAPLHCQYQQGHKCMAAECSRGTERGLCTAAAGAGVEQVRGWSGLMLPLCVNPFGCPHPDPLKTY